MCDGLGQKEIVRVGKISGPGLSRLCTTVHETLGQRRRLFVLSNTLARLSMSHLFSRYSPLSLEIVEKLNKCKFFGSHFYGGTTPISLRQIVSGATVHRLAKFSRVLFADLCLRSLAMKWNAEFTEGG